MSKPINWTDNNRHSLEFTTQLKMSSHLDKVKPRKRKTNSELRNCRKGSTKERSMKSPKTQPTAGSSTGAPGYRKPVDSLQTSSLISCECHLSTGSRRCSASPQLENQEGKENKLGAEVGRGLEANRTSDKREPEHMDYEETGKIVYPDDDSNEILPVEQFFGNLHTVQEMPQRPHAASSRGHHRRHYYAPENSDDDDDDDDGDDDDEELNLSSRQHEDGPGAQ